MDIMERLALFIYYKILPITFPKCRKRTNKLHLVISSSTNEKNNLKEVLTNIRCVLRKERLPICILKQQRNGQRQNMDNTDNNHCYHIDLRNPQQK
jgi:hypothetical protein